MTSEVYPNLNCHSKAGRSQVYLNKVWGYIISGVGPQHEYRSEEWVQSCDQFNHFLLASVSIAKQGKIELCGQLGTSGFLFMLFLFCNSRWYNQGEKILLRGCVVECDRVGQILNWVPDCIVYTSLPQVIWLPGGCITALNGTHQIRVDSVFSVVGSLTSSKPMGKYFYLPTSTFPYTIHIWVSFLLWYLFPLKQNLCCVHFYLFIFGFFRDRVSL